MQICWATTKWQALRWEQDECESHTPCPSQACSLVRESNTAGLHEGDGCDKAQSGCGNLTYLWLK